MFYYTKSHSHGFSAPEMGVFVLIHKLVDLQPCKGRGSEINVKELDFWEVDSGEEVAV